MFTLWFESVVRGKAVETAGKLKLDAFAGVTMNAGEQSGDVLPWLALDAARDIYVHMLNSI
ncbi:MAG TPA: hypothetical protein ENK04_13060 [Gammaproteobacteria bacterium]|nr:hypothetical protein [Gammaproteobacteria bacterium]